DGSSAVSSRPCTRPVPLLPIRPIPWMAKSPLSGERNLFKQQHVAAAAAMRTRGKRQTHEAKAYYDKLADSQKQQDSTREHFFQASLTSQSPAPPCSGHEFTLHELHEG
ncbi:hypothetical protein PMAYCL1PPCAC_14294, partial [Pristionchus mayeri]